MPQPKKSLLERVERNTFRADRYANLLHTQWLPLDPPAWADARLWGELLTYEQAYYRDPLRRRERESRVARFAALVRALHGGPVPAFALTANGSEPIPLALRRSPQWQRRMEEVFRSMRAAAQPARGARQTTP